VPAPIGPNQRWSMDFVHDSFDSARKFRMLTSLMILIVNACVSKLTHPYRGIGPPRSWISLLKYVDCRNILSVTMGQSSQVEP